MQQDLKLSSNTAKLHQMFGPKLYGDKYSFISEMCQNAVDSHRAAKQTKPVLVGLKRKINTKGNVPWTFYVKDEGLSFKDPDDFIAKVCTLLESGKSSNKTNDENCEMGEHGIGSISASAFQPVWQYDVVTPTGEYFFCIFRWIEGRGLTYDMSPVEKTTDTKSVTFSLEFEGVHFPYLVDAMKRKLCYFKDIQFEFDAHAQSNDRSLLVLNSFFKIDQAKDFQVSTLSKFHGMHVCLDQYSYDIKWDLLGIPAIPLNIGLRFGLGDGLKADITRENLVHHDDYKNIVMKKIRDVATWFIEKYNTGIPAEFENIELIHREMNKVKVVSIGSLNFNIDYLANLSHTPVKPLKFKGVSDKNLKLFISNTNVGKNLFWLSSELKSGKKMTITRNTCSYKQWRQNEVYYVDKPPSVATLTYLKNKGTTVGLYHDINIRTYTKGGTSIATILGLCSKEEMVKRYKTTGINPWREPVKEFKILQDSARKSYLKDVSSVTIPSTFTLPPRKARVVRGPDEMSMKILNGSYYRFSAFSTRVSKPNLANNHYIYGTAEESNKLNLVHSLIGAIRGNYVAVITEKEQKRITSFGLTNFCKVDDFLMGKDSLVMEVVTALKVSRFVHDHAGLFTYMDVIGRLVNSDLARDMQTLKSYSDSKAIITYIRGELDTNPLAKALIEIAEKQALYDKTIIGTLDKVASVVDNLAMIQLLGGHCRASSFKRVAEKAVTDIVEFRKKNGEWKNYVV